MIRVVLVDDHALIRRGVREILTEAGGIAIVGEAGAYGELRTLLREVQCDVLLLDINLPGRDGIDALATLEGEQTGIRVVILSQYPEDQYAIRALRGGAMGYLNKSSEPAQIVEAVRTVAAGASTLLRKSPSCCSTPSPVAARGRRTRSSLIARCRRC